MARPHGQSQFRLDPEGMVGQCIRCGATVQDDRLYADKLGNGYCAPCTRKVDVNGCELRYTSTAGTLEVRNVPSLESIS